MAKNKWVTYLLWMFGGWFGLHHFYLRRDRQALVWWCTGGFLGLGLLRDAWRIPDYVLFSNRERRFMFRLREQVRRMGTPPFSILRFSAQILFSVLLGYLCALAIPDNFGGIFPLVKMLTVPAAIAFGVHTVGNIGYEGGPFRPAIKGALILCPFFTLPDGIFYQSVASAVLFQKERVFHRLEQEDRGKSVRKRLAVLGLAATIITILWLSILLSKSSIPSGGGGNVTFIDVVQYRVKRIGDLYKKALRLAKRIYLRGVKEVWLQLTKLIKFSLLNIFEVVVEETTRLLHILLECLKAVVLEIWNSPIWKQIWVYTVNAVVQEWTEYLLNLGNAVWTSPELRRLSEKLYTTTISAKECLCNMWNSPRWEEILNCEWSEMWPYILEILNEPAKFSFDELCTLLGWMKSSALHILKEILKVTSSYLANYIHKGKEFILDKLSSRRLNDLWLDLVFYLKELIELLWKVLGPPGWYDLLTYMFNRDAWEELWFDITLSRERTPYRVLRLQEGASVEEIKQQYRRLALRYHPDKFIGDKGEAEKRFIEIREAYEILMKKNKASRRDRRG